MQAHAFCAQPAEAEVLNALLGAILLLAERGARNGRGDGSKMDALHKVSPLLSAASL